MTPEQRSRTMARIRSKDTKPEMFVRRALHAAGYRYSLHSKKLPGRPDLVLAKHHTVIFVHGCFWHGHTNCKHFRLPATRSEFWKQKISNNQNRDQKSLRKLRAEKWRVCIIWECAQRNGTWTADGLVQAFTTWLGGDKMFLELDGQRCSIT